jgi:hypothetical protein
MLLWGWPAWDDFSKGDISIVCVLQGIFVRLITLVQRHFETILIPIWYKRNCQYHLITTQQ